MLLEPTDEQVKLYHKMIDWVPISLEVILMWLSLSEVVKEDRQQTYHLLNKIFDFNQRIDYGWCG